MACPAIMQWHPLLLLLLLLVVAASAERSHASEEVTLSIATKKAVHVCSKSFLSVTVDPASLLFGPELGSRAVTALAMARELSPAYLRLAGHCTNRLNFHKDGLPEELADNYTITERQWVAVAGFAQHAGLQLVVALPSRPREGLDWDPRHALEFIALCDSLRLPVAAWQLGYELQLERATAWQVGRDVARLRRLLDAFPRYAASKIVAPDVVRFRERADAEWLRSFLESAGPALSALTWHPQFVTRAKDVLRKRGEDGEYEEDDSEGELYFPPDSIVWDREALNKALGRQGARLPLWIAESQSGESRGWFVDGLQWAHKLGVATRAGASVVFRQPDPRAFSTPTPEYWVSLLHKRLVGRTVLDSRVSGNRSHVHAFSACARPGCVPHAEGGVAVWVVNLLPQRARLAVKAGWGHPDKVRALQYSLTAAGPHPLHSRKVLLNGEPLALTPDGEVPELPPRERILGRTPVLPLPARSVTFLVFPEASVRLCEEEAAAAGPHFAVRHHSGEEEEEEDEEDEDYVEEEEDEEDEEEEASDEEDGGPVGPRDKRKLSEKHHLLEHEIEHELLVKPIIHKEKIKHKLGKAKLLGKKKLLKAKAKEHLVHDAQLEHLEEVKVLEAKKLAKEGIKKHHLLDEKKKHLLKAKAVKKEKEILHDTKLHHLENEKRKHIHKLHAKAALVPVLEKKHHIAKAAVAAAAHAKVVPVLKKKHHIAKAAAVAAEHHHHDLEHKLKQAELHHALESAAIHKEHALKEAAIHKEHALKEAAIHKEHHVVHHPVVKHVVHDPVVEHHVVHHPIVEHVVHDPVVERVVHEPVVERIVHEPIIQHVVEDPVVEHIEVVHPVVEKKHHFAKHAVPVHHHAEKQEHHHHLKEAELQHALEELRHEQLEEALEEVVHHEPVLKHKEHHHHDKWRHYRDVDASYNSEALADADARDLVRHRKQAPRHYSEGEARSWEQDEDPADYDYMHSPYKSHLKYLRKKYGYKDKSHPSDKKPRTYKHSASPQSLHEYSDEDIRKDYYLKRKNYSRKESPSMSDIAPPSSYSESDEHHVSEVAHASSRSSDRQFSETKTTQEQGTAQKTRHKFKPFEDFEDTTTPKYVETTESQYETHGEEVDAPNGENKTHNFQAVNTYPWFLYKTYNSPNIHVIYQNATTTSSPPVTHGSVSPPENVTESTASVAESSTTQPAHASQEQEQSSSTVSTTSEPHTASTAPPSGEQLSLIQVLDESPEQKSTERAARVPRHAPSPGPYVFASPAHELGQTYAKTKSSLRRRKEEELRLLKQKKKLRESMRANKRKDDSGAPLYDPNRSVSYEDVDYLFGTVKRPQKEEDSFPRGDVYLKEGEESSEERDEDYDYVEPDSSEDYLDDQLRLSKKKHSPVASIEDNDIDSPGYWQFFEDIKVQTPRKKSKYSHFGELSEAESHSDPSFRLEAEPEEEEDVKVVQEPAPTPEQDNKTKSSIAKILKLYFDKAQQMSSEKEMEDEYRKRKQKKKYYEEDDLSEEEEEGEEEEERDLERTPDYFDVDDIDESIPWDEIDGTTPHHSSSGRAKSAHGRDKRSLKETQMPLTSRAENDAYRRPKLEEKELEKMVDKIVAAVNKLDEESKAKLITLDLNSGEEHRDSKPPSNGADNSSYRSPGKRPQRSIASTGYDHETASQVVSEHSSKFPAAKIASNKQNGPKTAFENRDHQKLKSGKHEAYNRNSDISSASSKKAAAMNTGKVSEIMKFNSKANLDRHVYVVQPYSHSPENSVKKELKASYRVTPTKLKEPSANTHKSTGDQRAPDSKMSADRGHELHTNPNAQRSVNAGNQHPRQRRSAFDEKIEAVPIDHVDTPALGSEAFHRNLVGGSGLLGETVYWEDGYRGSPSDLRFITDQEGPQLKFSDTEKDMAPQYELSPPEESNSDTDTYHHETMTSGHPMISGGASFVFEYVGDDEDPAIPLHSRVHSPEESEGYQMHYQTGDFNIPSSIDTIILPEELETVASKFILPTENRRNDKFYYRTSSNANANRIIPEYDPVSEYESNSHIATVSSSQPDEINKNGFPFKYTESISGAGEYQILGVNDEVQKELNKVLGGIKNVVIAQRTSFEPIEDYFEDHLNMRSNNKKASRHKRSVVGEDEDEIEEQNTDDEIVEKKPYKLDSRLSFVHDDEEEDGTTDELLFNDTVSMNEIDDDDDDDFDDAELIQRNLIRPPKKYKQTLLNTAKGWKSTSRGSQQHMRGDVSEPKIPSKFSDIHNALDEALPNLESDRYEQSSSHISDVSPADEKLIGKSNLPMLEATPQGREVSDDVSDGLSKGILDPNKANTEGAEKDTEGELASTTQSSAHSPSDSDETVSVTQDEKGDDSSKDSSQETEEENRKGFFQTIMAKINSAFRVLGALMFPHKKQPSPSS